ncbi:hypothetical protein V6Z12_D07G080300 [Gossypium hirsutum]
MTICQGVNESLRDYVRSFSATTMIKMGVTDEGVIHAFAVGATHQQLRYIIIGNPPSKLSTLYEMVHKFLKGDEVERACANSFVSTIQQSNPPRRSLPRRSQGYQQPMTHSRVGNMEHRQYNPSNQRDRQRVNNVHAYDCSGPIQGNKGG